MKVILDIICKASIRDFIRIPFDHAWEARTSAKDGHCFVSRGWGGKDSLPTVGTVWGGFR